MIELWDLPLLFLTALAAGFVDSIAGGGGMITLPVLLSFGLNPQDALGTNKLQATFGSATASVHFARAGAVQLRESVRGFGITFVSAAVGTLVVRQIDPAYLRVAIPALLVVIAIYMLVHPTLGAEDVRPKMRRSAFDAVFGLMLGFYDGFFGPGTGTFWTMSFMLFLGFNMTRATASTKVMNFASNIASLLFFAVGGNVLFVAGTVMGVGQLIGARIGAGMVLTRGVKFIRPLFLTVVLIITLRLLWGLVQGRLT
jgi:uncharacterized protein